MTEGTDTDAPASDADRDLSDSSQFDPPAEWPDWWLPPSGGDLVAMVYDPDGEISEAHHEAVRAWLERGDDDGLRAAIERSRWTHWATALGPDASEMVHFRADERAIREFAALLNAYAGYARSPPDDPEDQHPLDALYALRAARQVLGQLGNHHPFITADDALVDAIETETLALDGIIERYEATCRDAGLPVAEPAGDDE